MVATAVLAGVQTAASLYDMFIDDSKDKAMAKFMEQSTKLAEEEKLQANAFRVGAYLMDQLNDLKQKHNIIGDVRGRGLFLGIELIKDPEKLTPASDEAEKIANDMKDHGILISTDGPDHNVLKIKPPMVFTNDNADQLVGTLNKLLIQDNFN